MSWNIDAAQIELLAKCNLKCRHCSNAVQNIDLELPLSEVKKIVDQLTCYGIKTIALSGGEPFLYQMIEAVIDYSYKKDIQIRINTNGVLLSEHIGWLKTYKRLLTLQVSMDGYDLETYKFIRNSSSFERVIKNIRMARRFGIKVEMKAMLSKKTATNYGLFQKLSKEIDVPVSYGYIARQGRAIDNEEICLSSSEIIENYHAMTFDGITTVQKGIFKSDHCPLIFSPGRIGTMRITNKGDCYPCIGLSGQALILGNIFEQTIKQMLANYDAYRKLILDMLYNEKCLICGARKKSPRPGCVVSCKYFGNRECDILITGGL